VLARIDLRGSALPGARELAGLLPRAATDIDSVLATVRPLCEDVRLRGAQAVREITARLDGVDLEDFAVPQAALDRALAECDPTLRTALEESISRVRKVHADQRRTDVTTQVVPGGTVTERWLPVRRVGLYVPGGLAPLLSSVVMNVVPAQIAGVGSIAVASPPQRDHGGLPDPGVLAACALLGVTEVYAVGGAQAIAMFGYGAGSCEPVDMVTGPGNVYTTRPRSPSWPTTPPTRCTSRPT
jgi:histidinol dehydrogenase